MRGLPTPELAPRADHSPPRYSEKGAPQSNHEKLLWWLDPARSKADPAQDEEVADSEFRSSEQPA